MKLGLAVLLLATGCRSVYVITPSTEREAWWTDCKPGQVTFCHTGSGPIRQVCDATAILDLVAYDPEHCEWERYDTKRPERRGAIVPYREKRQ